MRWMLLSLCLVRVEVVCMVCVNVFVIDLMMFCMKVGLVVGVLFLSRVLMCVGILLGVLRFGLFVLNSVIVLVIWEVVDSSFGRLIGVLLFVF